jgi:hypothetical protein
MIMIIKIRACRSAVWALIVIVLSVAFAYWESRHTNRSDFPVFYNAATYYLNKSGGISGIYDKWISLEYHLPEQANRGKFMHSPTALILLSPLGYLKYYTAKTVLASLSILSYLISVHLIITHLKLQGRWFTYSFFLSIIWPPFLIDIMFNQINAILLLLLVLAVCANKNGRSISCGLLIGIAAWFKLFPMGIAMALGIKNWRVVASCLLIFILPLMFPESIKWFSAMQTINPSSVSPAYHFLSSINPALFLIYSSAIVLVTAFIIFKEKAGDNLKIFAYSLPAIFLAAPAFELYHFTLLIISYLFLAKRINDNFTLLYFFTLFTTIIMICVGFIAGRMGGEHLSEMQILYYFSILFLWLTYSYIFVTDYYKARLYIRVRKVGKPDTASH